MKNFFQIIIYIFINLNLYESIIVLPLYRINPYKNITSIYEFINDLQPNNLYTKLKIGGPAQEIKVVIKEEEMAFSINSLYCNFESFYNRNESKTFVNLTKFWETNFNIYDSCRAQETFRAYTDQELKTEKKLEKMKFVYQKEKMKNINGAEKYCNCGVLNLQLGNYEIDPKKEFDFIFQLKQNDYINDYAWTIVFNETTNTNNEFEGYLLIGDYPHVYDDSYHENNLRTILDNLSENGWNLEFKTITTKNTSLTHYMTSVISFSTSFILGTEEYKSQIGRLFFNKYTSNGTCFEDSYSSHFITYYCLTKKFNKTDIDSFPSLNFYHYQYNFTFSLNGSDLFLERGGHYYFLVLFDRYDYRKWTFGKIFLKKYPLIFNPDSKMVGVYVERNKKEEDDGGYNGPKITRKNFVVVLIVIGILSFVIGIVLGSIVYSNQRKKSANEMKDEYLCNNDIPSDNPQEQKSNEIANIIIN